MAEENTLPSTEIEPEREREDAPLTIREDTVPERRFAADSIRAPLPPAVYERIGQFALTEKQEAILNEPLDPDEVDIRPNDGLIYASHEYCRRKLNEAFGRMGWTLIPGSHLTQEPQTNKYYRIWTLFVGGVYCSEAMAAREYYPNNKQQDLSDVAESIKSDCIRRVCKDLGIAHECWDRKWAEKWRRENAIQVVVKTEGGNAHRWRRIDADPFTDRQGNVIEVTARANEQAPRQNQNTATATASAPTGNTPPSSSPPAPAAQTSKVEKPTAEQSTTRAQASQGTGKAEKPLSPKPQESPKGVNPAASQASASATKPRLLDSQIRLIWAKARQAQVAIGQNAQGLIDLLVGFGIQGAETPGKTTEETATAMLKQVEPRRLQELLRKIGEAGQTLAENTEEVERI